MNSVEALERIKNGKFITCKVCDNNYNQWLTGCMCCRNMISKSKEVDIIEKDLEILEILKKHYDVNSLTTSLDSFISIYIYKTDKDFEKIKEWLDE